MSHLLVIVVCLALGLLLQRFRLMPESSAQVLNQYVINVALPALILVELPSVTFSSQLIIPVAASWSVMLLSALLVLGLSKCCRWTRDVKAVMLLLIPLGNTSFIGFPMVEALLGNSALPYAIIYDQLGSFIAVSTYGLFIAAYYSGGIVRPQALAKKLLTFPPFIAVIVVAVLMMFGGASILTGLLGEPLSRIGESLVPVVMVAVGLQWRFRLDREQVVPLSLALAIKLLLIPACLYVGFLLFGIAGVAAQASLLESAMPAMITAGALLISHSLAPKLAASIVGYGLLLSLLTVPMWAFLVSTL